MAYSCTFEKMTLNLQSGAESDQMWEVWLISEHIMCHPLCTFVLNLRRNDKYYNYIVKNIIYYHCGKMFDQMHQQVLKQKLFQISLDFYTVFNYFAKNSNSDWVHNLYRKLSDELSMNLILDQLDQQLWILTIFFNFSRFLLRIWLFSPKIAKFIPWTC